MRYFRWEIVCIFVFLLFNFLIQTEAAGATNKQSVPTMDGLQQQIEDLKNSQQVNKDLLEEIKNYRDYLQTETSKYQEGVQKYQDSLVSMFNTMITVAGLLIPVLIFGFNYFYGQSKKEFIEDMQKQIEQTKMMLLNEYEEKIKSKTRELEEGFDKQLMLFLEEEAVNIDALKQSIANERTYTSTRIWVTGSANEVKRIEQNELRFIEGRISEKPKTSPYNEKQLFAELEKGQIDILVYSCIKDEMNDITIKRIVQLLEEKGYHIPFIIYTYQRGNLDRGLIEELNHYFFTTISNFPTTLIGHIFSLGYAFNREVKKVVK